MQSDILVNIPENSVYVKPPDLFPSFSMEFEPYRTFTFANTIYFPYSGDFNLYPPNASISGKVVAIGAPFTCIVREHYESEVSLDFN